MIISEHQNYLRFWGKQRGAIDGGANWHAAAYHCLDVAASARALLEANELLRRQLAVLLAISEQQLVELMTFWMALHDVGKLSAPFNAQLDELWLPEMGERADVPDTPRHGEAAFLLWDKVVAADLIAWFPEGRRLVPLARAIFGHHGQPVAERLPATVKETYKDLGLDAARAFVRDAATLLLSAPIRLDQERLVRASFAIAGVAVMADWVGSSALFAYHNEPMPLATYWNNFALKTAQSAVRKFGLIPSASASERGLVALSAPALARAPPSTPRAFADDWSPTGTARSAPFVVASSLFAAHVACHAHAPHSVCIPRLPERPVPTVRPSWQPPVTFPCRVPARRRQTPAPSSAFTDSAAFFAFTFTVLLLLRVRVDALFMCWRSLGGNAPPQPCCRAMAQRPDPSPRWLEGQRGLVELRAMTASPTSHRAALGR